MSRTTAHLQVTTGLTVAVAAQRVSVAERTVNGHRKPFGGVNRDDTKRLKDLKTENVRCERLLAERALDHSVLQEPAEESTDDQKTPIGCQATVGGRAREEKSRRVVVVLAQPRRATTRAEAAHNASPNAGIPPYLGRATLPTLGVWPLGGSRMNGQDATLVIAGLRSNGTGGWVDRRHIATDTFRAGVTASLSRDPQLGHDGSLALVELYLTKELPEIVDFHGIYAVDSQGIWFYDGDGHVDEPVWRQRLIAWHHIDGLVLHQAS